GRTLHVFRGESVSFVDVLPRAGVPVTPIPCGDFVRLVRESGRTSGDRELITLASLLPDAGDEDELRRAFGGLLADNPALFRKDECHRLEERWRLGDGALDGPIAAYHARLTAAGRRVPTG
ncbi:MAG: hypothetical protein HOY71_31125, partial [Nonomuraea sp.]|nr:hypothetical protein [Nonomuraea sp.]